MKIPNGPSGKPTLSTNQFRTYGAAGFQLEEQEDDRGCPRLYYLKYVAEERLPEQARSYPLVYGSLIHDVMFAMEEKGLNPEDALEQCFQPSMPFEAFEEARRDLARYVERGSMPRDRFATLAVEQELDAVLMVHPELGEIRFRGFVDWIGVDPEDPSTLHVVDFKTNRSPIREEDLLGDVQMRAYDWLVRQNASKYALGAVNVVVHLDAVKFREVQIRYTDGQIDDWQMWAQAIALAILQDDTHVPTLNTYCSSCPVRHDCPAFLAMPETAASMFGIRPEEDDLALIDWRERANKMRLYLEKAVKVIDEEFKGRAEASGGLIVGKWQWWQEIDWKTRFDMRALHAALGDLFYAVVSTSQTALDRVTKDVDTSTLAAVNAASERVANGMRTTRKKV